MRWPRLAQIGPDWPRLAQIGPVPQTGPGVRLCWDDWARVWEGKRSGFTPGEAAASHRRRRTRRKEGRKGETTEIVMATLEERTEKHGKTDGKDDGCTLLDFHGSAPPSQTLLSLQNTPIQT